MEIYNLRLLLPFEMDYSCCFSLGGNLDFLDFPQRKFYNIDCLKKKNDRTFKEQNKNNRLREGMKWKERKKERKTNGNIERKINGNIERNTDSHIERVFLTQQSSSHFPGYSTSGDSPGQVVMGRDLFLRGCGFES